MKACGHGLKRELQEYRGVRLFEMNCGEIQCSLSTSDFFGPTPTATALANVKEWIDDAILGKVDGWHSINTRELKRVRAAA